MSPLLENSGFFCIFLKRIFSMIVVTGADGQLGQCLKIGVRDYFLRGEVQEREVISFFNKNKMDITDEESIEKVMSECVIGCESERKIIINCAAYTNVNNAENEADKVFDINVQGVKNLKNWCDKNDGFLIQISTDYVFDGKDRNFPYLEEAELPLQTCNTYGDSKMAAERWLRETNPNYLIIRTSWLYSEYGNNFFKTILNKIRNNESVDVVDDQIGTPTYAQDLADFICWLIVNKKYHNIGNIIHFTNLGTASWYDLAKAIEVNLYGEDIGIVKPSDSSSVKVLRPHYSVLSKKKLLSLGYGNLHHWLCPVASTMGRIILNEHGDKEKTEE